MKTSTLVKLRLILFISKGAYKCMTCGRAKGFFG